MFLRFAIWFSLLGCLGVGQAIAAGNQPEFLQPLVQRTEADLERVKAAALVMEARILERSGQQAKSLRKYQRAWRLDPDARVALKQIVPLTLELGRVDEATRYALLLTNSELDDPFLAERMAMLMSDQLEYDRSLQLYQRVLQLRSKNPNARDPIAMHFEMGRLYFLTDKHKQAAQAFRVVLDALENPVKHQLSDRVREAILAKPELAYALIAESFLEAGEYEDARLMFEKANSVSAGKTEGWLPLQLARVDYRAGQYRQARERLEAYVKQKLRFGGQTPYELLKDLMDKVKSGDDEKADPDRPNVIVRFRDWLSDDPDNFPLLSFVADLNRKDGGLKDAADLYEKSVASQPTLDAYRGLISTYQEMGESEKLVDALGRVAADLNNLDPFKSEIQAIAKDPGSLRELFASGRKRMKADPKRSKGVATACGLIAIEAEEYEIADEFFASVGEQSMNADVQVTWGVQLMVADQYQRAIEVFQRALDASRSEDNRAVFLFYLAGALQLDGQTEDALAAANEAKALRPDVPDFSLRPAWIFYNAGMHAEAKAAYTKWLEKYGEEYAIAGVRESVRDAKFVMSNIRLKDGEIEEAVEWLEQILDEFPSDVGAMNDLGYLMADHEISVARAMRMIRQAVDEEPENKAYRDSLGWALYRMGAYEEAIAELTIASSGDEPDPVILDHLADALVANGDKDAASTVWRKALKLIDDAKQGDGSLDDLKSKIKSKLEIEVAESR